MVETVELGMFARSWAVHRQKIAWLLGAGASAAAGVPTAAQIVDDLLLRLFADAHGLVRQTLDMSDPGVAERVRGYFDGRNGMPPLGSADDYAAAFALALPDPAARSRHLQALLAGSGPCFGQRVLGAVIASGAADLVVTTNFDELVERSVSEAQALAPARPLLSVAALGSPDRAVKALSDDGWPLLVKLHGDFRESALKNVADELAEQDAALRRAVVDASRRFGLAVAGYSGRDGSVMAMLHEAASVPGAWPAGLWWLVRDPDELSAEVRAALVGAAAAGVATRIVVAANFDEAMGALSRQVELEPPLRRYVDGLRPPARVVDAAVPSVAAGRFPVLRLNAIPVLAAPTTVLGAAAPDGLDGRGLRTALRDAGFRGAAVLGAGRAVAFGDPAVVGLALAADVEKGPVDFLADDVPLHLRSLACEALARGLARRLPARPVPPGPGPAAVVVAGPREPTVGSDGDNGNRAARDTAVLVRLRQAYGGAEVLGTLPQACGEGRYGGPRTFAEGVRLYLERRLGTSWLVFVPFTWTSGYKAANEARAAGLRVPPDPAAPWVKERWVLRRNEGYAAIVDAWAGLLAPWPETTVFVLPRDVESAPGAVGGQFRLSSTTAYSAPAA